MLKNSLLPHKNLRIELLKCHKSTISGAEFNLPQLYTKIYWFGQAVDEIFKKNSCLFDAKFHIANFSLKKYKYNCLFIKRLVDLGPQENITEIKSKKNRLKVSLKID